MDIIHRDSSDLQAHFRKVELLHSTPDRLAPSVPPEEEYEQLELDLRTQQEQEVAERYMAFQALTANQPPTSPSFQAGKFTPAMWAQHTSGKGAHERFHASDPVQLSLDLDEENADG